MEWKILPLTFICQLHASSYKLVVWETIFLTENLNVTQFDICWKCRSLEILWMMDECSSRPKLRKTISDPQTRIEPATFWWLVRRFDHWGTACIRQRICRTCTWDRSVCLGSLVVRASHRSSEGCGFDSSLGRRNRFSEVRGWRTFIYHPSHT